MQSGITASKELHEAFNELVSSVNQRGLVAGIRNEQLVPVQSISSTIADFSADLTNLGPLLRDDEAAYVILRRYDDASDGYVAVTFVPDTAPVRQKMLFASTRLSLVRELGSERFRETFFATRKAELTSEGFARHDKHGELDAPLTQEEQSLQDVKEAEAQESRGASARSSHVSSGVSFPITDDALQALRALEGSDDNLVQLVWLPTKIDTLRLIRQGINIPKETIELISKSSSAAATLAETVSNIEPRYSFFRYQHEHQGQQESPIVFIYTCPSGSKVKERMLYASSRASVIATATADAGLVIAKKLEASSPDEITATTIHEEFHPRQEEKAGFSRPKRPGRR
ncbi:MAG: Twinfilin-1 [Caeruleum heppii]|nr:MAG: Twinfilin-1 [Caeruleum heppii]